LANVGDHQRPAPFVRPQIILLPLAHRMVRSHYLFWGWPQKEQKAQKERVVFCDFCAFCGQLSVIEPTCPF